MTELERNVYRELDKRKGQDLIKASYEVQEMFNLTDEEMFVIYDYWYNGGDYE